MARRGTWTFLDQGTRGIKHVHLATQVDATRMTQARTDSAAELGYVAMVVAAVAGVVAKHPAGRTVLRTGPRGPRFTEMADVQAKVLLDRTWDGVRCVLPCTIEAAQRLSADQIQQTIDRYRQAPLDGAGPLADLVRLQHLPLPLVRLAYRIAAMRPAWRARVQGTVAVTSVGQEAVTLIHPLISGALGFGIGHIEATPLVKSGAVVVAPAFMLTLAFDHRVIDGAPAAELLAEVKERLENWSPR
ncbi:2-oxo acid dehydrogenase subunit E2 [Nocardia sp. NBC_00511]|uniref:2-oxo acid dehydrogenase subunit E2 n=1 Tax=Nocardia sp. NBC_00511 TaxID=2903591 RepID=UPI0030DF0136